jgi:hypothetical protein
MRSCSENAEFKVAISASDNNKSLNTQLVDQFQAEKTGVTESGVGGLLHSGLWVFMVQ